MAAADPIPQLISFLKNDPAILQPGHKEVVIGRAPARLDVMGGISDITGGLVCALPLQAAAAVAVQRRDDRKLVIKTYNEQLSAAGDNRVELSLDDFYGTAALLPNATLRDLFTGGRHWAAYIAGVFPMLAKHRKMTRRSHGANIACFSNVPFGVGLGSSAAVVCAMLSALTAAFQILLDPLEIAVLSQKLEHQMVGTPRGIMDPAASVLGKKDQLLVMQCQPHELKEHLPVPEGTMFAAINSGMAPPIGGPAYQTARVSAAMAQVIIARMYQDFGNKKDPTRGYLANVPVEMYERYFRPLLSETLTGAAFVQTYGAALDRVVTVEPARTYAPRAAADFHVRENARTAAFVEDLRTIRAGVDAAARQGAAMAAGKRMAESHAAYSEKLQLGSSATDLLVELVRSQGVEKGFYGARVMGVGGGGSVAVFAAATEATRKGLEEIAAEYQARTGRAAQVVQGSSNGASEMPAVKVPLTDLVSAQG